MKVTVYHGTAAFFRPRIELNGITHKFGRQGYVFVTTNRDQALYYAKPATAFAMTPAEYDGHWPPNLDFDAPPKHEPIGLIVEASIDEKRLKPDPYSPLHEPDQYKVYRGIKPTQIVDYQEVEFPELRNREDRVMALGLWYSIQRSLDDTDDA